MKCPKCNGSGVDDDRLICYLCGGSGVIEMTNEEWFCGLSTEEKAKWLNLNSEFMYDCGQRDVFPKVMYEEDWEYWLKEKHNG